MLTLQPHDLPDDGDGLPSHTITQARWHGEIWQIGVGGTTRPEQPPSRALVCQKAGSSLLYWTRRAQLHPTFYNDVSEMRDDTSTDPFGLRMSFANAQAKTKWGRGLFLGEGLQLRQPGERARFFLLLSPHGWGSWRDLLNPLDTYPYRLTPSGFMWSPSNEHTWLLDATAHQLIERMGEQWNKPNSDVAFALQFASLSLVERRNLLWPCKRGDTGQMETLLRQALLTQDELWETQTQATWHVNLAGPKHKDSYDYIHISHMNGVWIEELDRIFQQLFDFFAPQRDEELIERHLCLQDTDFSNLALSVESPSHHQRLEAAIEWRDWQNEHCR